MEQALDCPSCGAPLNLSSRGPNPCCPYCQEPIILPPEWSAQKQILLEGSPLSLETIQAVMAYLKHQQKIPAILTLQRATGMKWIDARDAVEGAQRSLKNGGDSHGEPEALLAQVAALLPYLRSRTRSKSQPGIAFLEQSLLFWRRCIPALLLPLACFSLFNHKKPGRDV